MGIGGVGGGVGGLSTEGGASRIAKMEAALVVVTELIHTVVQRK